MSSRAAILAQLGKSPNLAVERVLGQAMSFEQAPTTVELAEVVLERNNRAGWVALIRNFDRLGEELQRRLIERPRELFGPLSETIDETSGDSRANVIHIVRQAADAKLVTLLSETLMDARDEVRQLAGESLLDAIRRFRINGYLSPNATDNEFASLQRAIDFALAQYKTHRQQPALHAALIFERRQDSAMWASFSDGYAEASRAANIILRAPTDPLLAPALYLALASPLKVAAVYGFSSGEGGELGHAIAKQSFRLVDPLIGRASMSITHAKILASPKRDVPWNNENWIEYLRLIERLGLPAPLKIAWLGRMLEVPAGAVQKIMTLVAIAATELPDGIPLLAAYVIDPDERVARVAARALLGRKRADTKPFLEALATSPHESVRKMAAIAAGPARFEKHWKDYPKLPPAVQVNKTRALSSNDMSFGDQLRAKLESPQHADTVQALRLLQTLSDLRPYRADIIRLCGDDDPRVVAGAVRLVGRLDDPSLLEILEAAAQHTDPRVRANSVEAMEQLHVANRSQQVLAMLNSRHNRERANAIKALSSYDFVTARETLAKMLLDPNPMHRISALWVVDQLAVLDIIRQVTTLARRDGNAHVRGRAAELLDRVTAAAQVAT